MDEIADVGTTTNRRAHPRHRALKNALIVFNDGKCTMKCHILEVSETGAKLVPADPLLCPKEFVLKAQIGSAHDCEVVWRKGTHVGVRYVTQDNPSKVTQASSSMGIVVLSRETPLYSPDTVHERGVLEQAIDEIIAQSEDREKSAALLVVSVLNMVAIANIHGNAMTNPVLLDIAWRLRGCLRASDIIGRLSHDRLGIVLPSVRHGGTSLVAEKIRGLSSTPAKTAEGLVDIKLGVEYMLFPVDGLTGAELIGRMQGETALARYANLRQR